MDIFVSPLIAALVPGVMALTALFKTYTGSYWAPLVSLALGIGGSFLLPQATWQATLLVGIIAGVMASGFWSQGKTLAGN